MLIIKKGNLRNIQPKGVVFKTFTFSRFFGFQGSPSSNGLESGNGRSEIINFGDANNVLGQIICQRIANRPFPKFSARPLRAPGSSSSPSPAVGAPLKVTGPPIEMLQQALVYGLQLLTFYLVVSSLSFAIPMAVTNSCFIWHQQLSRVRSFLGQF